VNAAIVLLFVSLPLRSSQKKDLRKIFIGNFEAAAAPLSRYE